MIDPIMKQLCIFSGNSANNTENKIKYDINLSEILAFDFHKLQYLQKWYQFENYIVMYNDGYKRRTTE